MGEVWRNGLSLSGAVSLSKFRSKGIVGRHESKGVLAAVEALDRAGDVPLVGGSIHLLYAQPPSEFLLSPQLFFKRLKRFSS